MAVSLQFAEHAQYEKAARLAREIIQQVLENKGRAPQLYNLNIPTAALTGDPRLRIVPMDVAHYGERFEKRIDPWGRAYYWATGEPPPPLGEHETDLTAINQGLVTLTPLDYNMTKAATLAEIKDWQFHLHASAGCDPEGDRKTRRPVVQTAKQNPRSASATRRGTVPGLESARKLSPSAPRKQRCFRRTKGDYSIRIDLPVRKGNFKRRMTMRTIVMVSLAAILTIAGCGQRL